MFDFVFVCIVLLGLFCFVPVLVWCVLSVVLYMCVCCARSHHVHVGALLCFILFCFTIVKWCYGFVSFSLCLYQSGFRFPFVLCFVLILCYVHVLFGWFESFVCLYFGCSFVCLFVCLFICSIVCYAVCPFVRLSVRSFVCVVVFPFVLFVLLCLVLFCFVTFDLFCSILFRYSFDLFLACLCLM